MKQEIATANINSTRKTAGEIAIVTCCIDDWGGSEELWARSLPFLQSEGHTITIYKAGINPDHPEYVKLASAGVQLQNLAPQPQTRFVKLRQQIGRKLNPGSNAAESEAPEDIFAEKLKQRLPVLVIIAQGINFDGTQYGRKCAELNIKYVLVAQKAVDFYWPYYKDREMVISVFLKASKCFFVSAHNLRLTEEQLGMKLNHASVVFNPVKVSREVIKYPSTDQGYQLACIGRYFLLDKGQDILLRILSGRVWRERPVTVNFIGAGYDKEALMQLADFLQVKNVRFLGHTGDMQKVWAEHHALILPSRSEGMPLVLLEAMSAGRPVIVSNAGGNAEIVEEGVTGFIGAPFEESFEQAMERAWNSRQSWKEIGENASNYIRNKIPASPELEFAKQLKQTIHG